MPRFVVLRHECSAGYERPSHWDFMLQCGAVLRTWALLQSPDCAEPQPGEALPDHRTDYLTYEGPISGNRGTVSRWDEGTFETISSMESNADVLELNLQGGILRGRVTLQQESNPQWWRYGYEPKRRKRPDG